MIGKTLSHYRILAKLGEGGMGIVYKARDTRLDRDVALKFLPPELTKDPKAKERFVREARAASALDHTNICTVHDIEETGDGQIFIVMACYDGETLKAKIERGPLKIEDALDAVIQVAEGLAKAHAQGIIHRDIKPANLLVTEEGVVKIVDFGLTKLLGRSQLTLTSSAVGTAVYMSPEQGKGEDVDQRTDIWSLGVVLYEAITGQPPFQGEYDHAILYSILNAPPRPMTDVRSAVPLDVQRIVDRALCKSPADRYQRVEEMLIDMREAQRSIRSEQGGEGPPHRRRRYILFTIGAAIVVVAGAGLLLWIRPGVVEKGVGITSGMRRIAVLPLDNFSPDPADEYFADGTTEELISGLSRIGGLHVIARTSVMQYKHLKKSVAEIGRELNVGTILEGSVRKAGNTLRITVQLIDVHSQEHLWSQDYDREFADVFSIQNDIARRVADALKIHLLAGEERQIGKMGTENLEAYNLYLRGRYFWNKRTERDLAKSIAYFTQAVETNPTFALGYAGLADAYNMSCSYSFASPMELVPKARAAAARALEIDSTIAEAHSSLGWVKATYDWDWGGAEKEYMKALTLSPNSSTAHHWYGLYLAAMGRSGEAIAELERAKDLDPLSMIINVNVGWVLYFEGRFDKAVEQIRSSLEIDSNFAGAHWKLRLAYQAKGMTQEAFSELDRLISLVGNTDLLLKMRNAYHASGYSGALATWADHMRAQSTESYVSAYDIAAVDAYLGNNEKAFQWLDTAFESRDGSLMFLKVDAQFESIRGDPRFTELLKRIGLAR